MVAAILERARALPLYVDFGVYRLWGARTFYRERSTRRKIVLYGIYGVTMETSLMAEE